MKSHHGWQRDNGGYSIYGISEPGTNAFDVPIGFRDAIGGSGFDDEIAENSMHSILHLGREAVHDTIDHDQRSDTQGD
jgi:hypothetical protein